mgnify:CR=1 FL=1
MKKQKLLELREELLSHQKHGGSNGKKTLSDDFAKQHAWSHFVLGWKNYIRHAKEVEGLGETLLELVR